jgi:hypothetical protein
LKDKNNNIKNDIFSNKQTGKNKENQIIYGQESRAPAYPNRPYTDLQTHTLMSNLQTTIHKWQRKQIPYYH